MKTHDEKAHRNAVIVMRLHFAPPRRRPGYSFDDQAVTLFPCIDTASPQAGNNRRQSVAFFHSQFAKSVR